MTLENGQTYQIVYGNVVVDADGERLVIASGSKDSKGDYLFQAQYGNTGLYTILFNAGVFSNTPAVVLTQIYNGGITDVNVPDNQPYTGGNTRDNAVLVGISASEFKLITGDSKGHKNTRMFGFLAVGSGLQTADVQMLWGTVFIDAAMNNKPVPNISSNNFTVQRYDTGLFEVTFDNEAVDFSDTPTVAVTQVYNGDNTMDMNPSEGYDGGNPLDNAVVIAVDKTKFRFITGDSHGNHADRMFSFVVVGPGSQETTSDNPLIAYGNIGYKHNYLNPISGSEAIKNGLVELTHDSDGYHWDKPGKPSGESLINGFYGILNEDPWILNPTVIATQIYAGKGNSSDIADFTYSGGSTHDNAVVVSCGSGGATPEIEEVQMSIAGDSHGHRAQRMFGIILIGTRPATE